MKTPRTLKILLTICDLRTLGGGQSVTRDLYRGLAARGHEVAVYSRSSTDPADPSFNAGIVRCVDPRETPFVPDIIHGQHQLDAMTAIFGRPGVPALYHCHGAVMNEMAPRHPRIYRYLAMSRTLRDRMIIETSLAPDTVEVLLNWVDLEKFRHVRQAPAKLKRAIFYNGHHRSNSPTLAAIAQACDRLGIALETGGRKNFLLLERPEEDLPKYDLVFASGKSAIDALACGCAVIVLGRNSSGPLVTPENFEDLRQVNFSLAGNCLPPLPEDVVAQIRKYSPAKNSELTRLAREVCDRERTIDKLERIYGQVITESRASPPDMEAEMSATIHYLRRIAPFIRFTRGEPGEVGERKLLRPEHMPGIASMADPLLTVLNRVL